MSNDIWRWTAEEMAHGIRTRKISSREAVGSVLARVDEVNPRINAVVDLMADEALAAADRADKAVEHGEPLGLLHGVPVTVKINIDYAGRATTNGVVAFKDNIAKEDSAPVVNFRKAGAIIFGRTNRAFDFRAAVLADVNHLNQAIGEFDRLACFRSMPVCILLSPSGADSADRSQLALFGRGPMLRNRTQGSRRVQCLLLDPHTPPPAVHDKTPLRGRRRQLRQCAAALSMMPASAPSCWAHGVTAASYNEYAIWVSPPGGISWERP